MQFFSLVENNVEQPARDRSRDRTKRFGDDETAFDIFDREGQCVDQRIGRKPAGNFLPNARCSSASHPSSLLLCDLHHREFLRLCDSFHYSLNAR